MTCPEVEDRQHWKERWAMYKKSFGKRLTQLMNERGWDKARAAVVFEVSETMISKYMDGYNFPETESFFRMADIFEVSADWLGGRSEVREVARETRPTPQRNSGTP